MGNEKRKKGYYECLSRVVADQGGTLLTPWEEYVDCNTQAAIRCNSGHMLTKSAARVVIKNGYNCDSCMKEKRKKDEYERLSYAVEEQGGTLITPLEEYVNTKTKVSVRCENGHFLERQSRSLVLNHKLTCSPCVKENMYAKLSAEIEIRGGKLLTTIDDFEKIKSNVNVKCKNNHMFTIYAWSVVHHNYWCPGCKIYVNESYCRMVIETLTGKNFYKCRPEWMKCPTTGKLLEIDMLNEELKLALEYNGKQHYEFIPRLHKNYRNYIRRLEIDKLKKEMLYNKGYKFIEVPHTEQNNIYNYILECTNNLGIPIQIPAEVPKRGDIYIKYCPSMATEKECSICNVTKSHYEFHKHSSRLLGITSACKECSREQGRKSREKTKEAEKDTSIHSGTCCVCKEEKNLGEFTKNIYTKSGYSGTCKKCSCKKTMKSYQKNKMMSKSKISEKECRNCKKTKSVSEFAILNSDKTGYMYWCKECSIHKQREYVKKVSNSPKNEVDGKKCSKCKAVKPSDDFTKSSKSKTGLASQCRECTKETRDNSKKKVSILPKITVTEKKCSKCGTIKPIDNFDKQISSKTGYRSSCKDCRSTMRKK